MREVFEWGLVQTDPNFANYMYQPESGRIVLLDFGSTIRFRAAFMENYRRICLALIDDVLEMSRIEAWRVELIERAWDPSASSIRNNWLYLAVRSARAGAPVLI